MNMYIFKPLFVVLLSISLLMGCGVTKEEAINESIEVAEDTFNEAKPAYNETIYGIRFSLPEDFKIISESESNIILAKGRQEFILFVNPQEALDSEAAFQALEKAKGEKIIESFKRGERFGYFSAAPLEDNEYELIVGIGGVKLTTKTKISDMVEHTKAMMEIANSVEYKIGED
ncbi:hypothetical protein [Calidifontibacillus oryziterrae]|uniref:hypothetical protein n=1 Tax=Calidifontibacillus oryziterrae TaxID=1191699 RepID=UPI0002E78EB8|nr:hypothetical protein [Calidifontibacillus oryziterrae]